MKIGKLLAILLSAIVLWSFVFLNFTVSGTVYDENGNTISNAAVQEKGSSRAVSTDSKGNFSIEVSGINATLIVTAVGFQQKEVVVRSKGNLKVELKKASSDLQEVVVVGYGKTKVGVLTGALAPINPAMKSNKHYGRTVMPQPMVSSDESWRYNNNFNREGYDNIRENTFLKTTDNPLSTFSIDVDGASYSNIRRFINSGQLPPEGAVRIEEMINYFSYKYPQPKGDVPFSIHTEYTVCPWNTNHQLVSIGLQGKKIDNENLPASNLVFLIDVSGSMMSEDKLPLVQASMKLLTDQLRPHDKVSIVVYAGNAGLVLPPTDGNDKTKIKSAIDGLQAGGSTAGGEGIKLAYKVATENFIKNGNNRVVLCTDGDFNVGISSDDALERLIEKKRESGVYLSVLGYGMGNYQDAKMQKLADKGNGNHAYIDNLNEARKVLIHQFGGTMFTIAKDVKLQIEFNPARVQGYRLIGYENRMLAKEDFNDDKKDAGELGSGHTVTALYEIIPAGIDAPELRKVDDLKYQKTKPKNVEFVKSDEVMTVKFRYKNPDSDKSLLLQKIIKGVPNEFGKASDNLHLAAAVAQFGMLLRDSEFKGEGGYSLAESLLSSVLKREEDEHKTELMQLMKKASGLKQISTRDKDELEILPDQNFNNRPKILSRR